MLHQSTKRFPVRDHPQGVDIIGGFHKLANFRPAPREPKAIVADLQKFKVAWSSGGVPAYEEFGEPASTRVV